MTDIFQRKPQAQVEARFPDKGTDCVERRMANYLSPQFRGAHLDMSYNLESAKQEIEDKIRSYKDILDENQTDEAPEVADFELSRNSKLIKRHEEKLKRGRTEINLAENKIRKEMKRYESFSNPGKNVNILEWWKTHEGVFPLLASLAKKILAIPASSAKSERVFSTGGNIVTPKRKRLSPRNVQNLNVIKENMAMIDHFLQFGGYTVKKYDEEENPFEDLEVVETFRDIDPDQDHEDAGGLDDLDEEDIIYLDDDLSDEDSIGSDDDLAPEDIAFIID